MGLSHVWIGIESVKPPFKKRFGKDITEVFDRLHSLGVTTTGSVIFGLDHHTPDTLPREVDLVIRLRPSTVQLSNLMAADGTPLRDRLEKEKRIRKIGFKDADLYSEIIDHPAFKPGEICAAIDAGYQRIYDTLGPSLYRIVHTWWQGYKKLKDSPDRVLRDRAGEYARRIGEVVPVFLAGSSFLPNTQVKQDVQQTLDEIFQHFGGPDREQKNAAELMKKIFELEQVKGEALEAKPVEPPLTVSEYGDDYFKESCRFFQLD